MMKTRMVSTRINIIAEAQLLYTPYTLKIRMLYDIKYQFIWYGNKTMHRIIKDLTLIVCHFTGESKTNAEKN